MDLLQLADRHVRVNFRAVQVRVPERLLDVAKVCAAFEHQRRRRMPAMSLEQIFFCGARRYVAQFCRKHRII